MINSELKLLTVILCVLGLATMFKTLSTSTIKNQVVNAGQNQVLVLGIK